MADEYDGYDSSEGTSDDRKGTAEQVNVEPVKLSKKKVGFILIALIFVFIIIILTLSRTSISKSVESTGSSNKGNNGVQISVSEVDRNGDEASQISSEFVPNSGEVSTSPQSEPTVPENTGSEVESSSVVETGTSEVVESSTSESVMQGVIEPVVDPEPEGSIFEEVPIDTSLGAETSTNGIVTGAHMYRVENSYTYGIDIFFATEDGTRVDCLYFCPKGTYDKLDNGDVLKVKYAMDTQGNVCVISISK